MSDWLQRLIWATLAAAAMAAFGLRTPQIPLSPLPPAGAVLAQLGAFGDLPEAMAAWEALRVKAPDLLADLSPVLVKAEHGGNVFFRLRVLMADMPAARTFCEAMLNQDLSCIPVTQR